MYNLKQVTQEITSEFIHHNATDISRTEVATCYRKPVWVYDRMVWTDHISQKVTSETVGGWGGVEFETR